MATWEREKTVMESGEEGGRGEADTHCAKVDSNMTEGEMLGAIGRGEKGGGWRDEWACDFCGLECFCWTVGADGGVDGEAEL